jgi:hypothetical protein
VRFLSFALLLSVACATPPRRAGYVLARLDDLVVSNSPVVFDHPAPVVRHGRLEVPYVLLVLNRGPEPWTLSRDSLGAKMEYLSLEPRCHGLSDPAGPRELPLDIAPGMVLRLGCVVPLSDEAARLASAGDRVIKLRLSTANRAIEFDYFLGADP